MDRKTLIAASCVAGLSLGLATCAMPSARMTNSNSPSTQSTTGAEAKSDDYRLVSANVWEVDEKGTKVEARLETVDEPMKHVAPGFVPSRLSIKNLATNETIFQENSGDTALSAYVRALNDEVGEALVVFWAGGSAERIEILDVDATRARVILYESYRIDAALIDLSGVGNLDVLITTAVGGAGPFFTTRYVWKGDRYQQAGSVPYKLLVNTVEKQFTPTKRFGASRK